MRYHFLTLLDLGVHFSADLSWSHHISIITAKAYKMLGLLRRSFTCNVLSVRKRLYISLVRSQLSYGSQVWRPSLIKDIVNLERVQRKASKYFLSDYVLLHVPIKIALLSLVCYLWSCILMFRYLLSTSMFKRCWV